MYAGLAPLPMNYGTPPGPPARVRYFRIQADAGSEQRAGHAPSKPGIDQCLAIEMGGCCVN